VPNKPLVTCKTSTICIGETTSILAEGCVGKVVWSNGNTGSTLTFNPLVSGNYTFSAKCVSNSGICESESSKPIKITVGGSVPKPIVLAEIQNFCPFETVDLNNAILGSPSKPDASFEYHASNSPNSTIITTPGKVGAGIYYLFERSPSGCFSDGSLVTVKINSCGVKGVRPDSTMFVDISLKKVAESTTVPIDGFVNYSVVVKNSSHNIATNIIVRDVIPAGLAIETISSNANYENGVVTAKISSLSKTDSVKFTYRAKVTAGGKIENKVELFSLDQIDQVSSNNTSLFTINATSTSDLIGLSKNLGTIIKIADNKYEVPFTFYIANMGSTKLSNLKLVDDLGLTFGNGVEILDDTILVKADAGLIANPKYTGRGSNTSLLIDSLSNIEVGKTLTVSFKVTVDVSKTSNAEFFNTSKVYAGSTHGISDISTNGTNPDPDGNGNPADNSIPTKVELKKFDITVASIASSLSIIDSSFIDHLTYRVTYMALVKNTGNSDLRGVYFVDSLGKTFPTNIQFAVSQKPSVGLNDVLIPNPQFNGHSDNKLTLSDSTKVLQVGKVDTVIFTVDLKFGKNYGPYLNSVYVSGKDSSGKIVSDISNSGIEIIQSKSDSTQFTIPKDTSDVLNQIKVPGGFSPNADGINDNLIVNIEGDLEIEKITIVNRWGAKVFESDNVDRKLEILGWDGKVNCGILLNGSNNYAPSGTYYYYLKVKGNEIPIINFITLIR
jgi:gliding motility-associated-like protein/uncharacterized repeat protein (TIGR01451 family)